MTPKTKLPKFKMGDKVKVQNCFINHMNGTVFIINNCSYSYEYKSFIYRATRKNDTGIPILETELQLLDNDVKCRNQNLKTVKNIVPCKKYE
jgi:hypothetical protein